MKKTDEKKYKIIAICNIVAMAFFLIVGAYNIFNSYFYRTHGGSPSMILGIVVEVIRLINKIVLGISILSLGKANKNYIAAGALCILQQAVFFTSDFISGSVHKPLMAVSMVLLVVYNLFFSTATQKAFDQIDGSVWDFWKKFRTQYLIAYLALAVFAVSSLIPGFGMFCAFACALIALYAAFLNILMIIYIFKAAKSISEAELNQDLSGNEL